MKKAAVVIAVALAVIVLLVLADMMSEHSRIVAFVEAHPQETTDPQEEAA